MVGLIAAMPISVSAADISFPGEDVTVKEGEIIYPDFYVSGTMVYSYRVTDCSGATVANEEFEYQIANSMFAGWYTDRELTQAYDFTKAVESNFTLYAKWTANPFEDVNTADYFFKPVLWAVDKGVTTDLSADSFGPNSTCTRAQIVTFLYRAMA